MTIRSPRSPFAVSCSSGGFKCVFVHGVLSAFEEAGIRADAYGCASASVLPAAAAAGGLAGELGVEYWHRGAAILTEEGEGMSEMILRGLTAYGPRVRERLFTPGASRLLIAASSVETAEAAEQTQGMLASRLGRQLLISMARGDHAWIDEHLAPALFDTTADREERRITADNFDEIAYASSRMLHAWRVPASIDGRPFVDASYTCSNPAEELAGLGYDLVIAIGSQPAPLHRDLFGDRVVPGRVGDTIIHLVAPDEDPTVLGVEFTKGSPEGLERVYLHGWEKGMEFLEEAQRAEERKRQPEGRN